jgi:SAM-dependent methyltransferase
MQYLIHLLRGGYLGDEYCDGQSRKLLDVGCGSGFNCVTFAMMGWDVSGCEINEEVCAHARETIAGYGYDISIDVGENENLPYDDGTFDFLFSMNVIHYVQSEEAARRTVSEYARVLKTGGRVFISTNHPDNWLVKHCEELGSHMVRITVPGDYRDRQTLFLFDSELMLEESLSPHFSQIVTGENRFDFFTRTLRHLIVTGVRE